MPRPTLPPYSEVPGAEESEPRKNEDRLGHFHGTEDDDRYGKFSIPSLFIGIGWIAILIILLFSGMIQGLWGIIEKFFR